MRTLLVVALVSALAAPDAAHAAWWSRGHRSGPSSAPRAAGAPRYAPAPPRYAPAPGGMRAFVAPGPAPYRGPAYAGYAAPAPYPAPAYGAAAPAYAGVAVAPRPLWWSGGSWGYGYYPVIGARPAYDPSGPLAPGADPDRVVTTLDFRAAGSPDGGAAGTSLYVDGRTIGFHAGVDGVAVRPDPTRALDTGGVLAYATAHLAFAIVSDDVVRIRLEAGGSMLSIPDAGPFHGAPYAATVAFGPDFGVSGHLGLLGPVGLEGYVRVTPYPVTIVDARAAVAMRAGALALTVGWRDFDVRGDGLKAPSASWNGPEVGLGVQF